METIKQILKNIVMSKLIRNIIIIFLFIFTTELNIRLLMNNPIFDWATFRILLSSFI